MAKSNEKNFEIVSITYKVNGEKHVMKPPKQSKSKKAGKSKDLLPANANGENCNAGDTRCVNGKLQRCRAMDDEGTCIWFVTSESC